MKWKGLGFIYLLLLSIICSIPYTLTLNSAYSTFIKTQLPELIKDFPEIEIVNGEARSAMKQPFFIYVENEVIAIIDPTGKITNLDDNEAMLLIAKNRLIIKGSGLQKSEIDLKDLGDFKLNREIILKNANYLKSFAPLFIYPMVLSISFLENLIQVLIISLFGFTILIFKRNESLQYRDILRITSVAVTPSIVIKTFFNFIGMQYDFLWIFYLIVALAYVKLAIETGIKLKEPYRL